VGPRFSGKVREEPQRRESGGGRNYETETSAIRKNGADIHQHVSTSPPAQCLTSRHLKQTEQVNV